MTEQARTGKQETIQIREAQEADAPELLAIYAPYVLKTVISFETEVPTVEEFQRRIRTTKEKYPYLVATDHTGRIIGYAYTSAFKTRVAYSWSVETSIYIMEGLHGRGIGKLLYNRLEEISRQQNICNMCACISHPNPDSEAFHEKMGYRRVALFHKSGYKMGQWVDMIWMEKGIKEHQPMPDPWIPYPDLNKNR